MLMLMLMLMSYVCLCVGDPETWSKNFSSNLHIIPFSVFLSLCLCSCFFSDVCDIRRFIPSISFSSCSSFYFLIYLISPFPFAFL